ncbi:unnamed protein product, partial [Chrysoparadoxa australica]
EASLFQDSLSQKSIEMLHSLSDQADLEGAAEDYDSIECIPGGCRAVGVVLCKQLMDGVANQEDAWNSMPPAPVVSWPKPLGEAPRGDPHGWSSGQSEAARAAAHKESFPDAPELSPKEEVDMMCSDFLPLFYQSEPRPGTAAAPAGAASLARESGIREYRCIEVVGRRPMTGPAGLVAREHNQLEQESSYPRQQSQPCTPSAMASARIPVAKVRASSQRSRGCKRTRAAQKQGLPPELRAL